MLRLFGMFSRTTKQVGSDDEADYRLPLYYHILANAMKGSTSFQLLTTKDILDTLSTMSPSKYIFSGTFSTPTTFPLGWLTLLSRWTYFWSSFLAVRLGRPLWTRLRGHGHTPRSYLLRKGLRTQVLGRIFVVFRGSGQDCSAAVLPW